MRYEKGEWVYLRDQMGAGRMKIVGLEFEWQGCVERVSFCKLRSESGLRIRASVDDVITPGEAVAERLKGKAYGHDVGV